MKKTFGILLAFFVMCVQNSGYAFDKSKLDKYITQSELNEKSTIAISIKNTSNHSTVYEKNQNKLLHPASTLKLITMYFAFNTLGYDYFFKTGFYTDNKNNLYIKLGADPTLTSGQLKTAIQKIKDKGYTSFNNLYIDDSIIDKKEFSPGWMWDDDTSPYTPKVSSYNLDSNTIRLNLVKGENSSVKVISASKYPLSVFSNVKADKTNMLEIERYNWNNPELIELYGAIVPPKTVEIPYSSMRRYYIFVLEKALEDSSIKIKATQYASKILPSNAKMICEISNPITRVLMPILQKSNNLMAETLYKLAGGFKYGRTGSDDISLEAMKNFYEKYDIDFNSVIIKDGCGVSRNNLLSVEWMNNVLDKIYNDKNFDLFKDNMAIPGEGTLSSRLFDLRGDVWLKTGTLSNISSIAGFINSQDGNTYAVTLFVQNFTENPKLIKQFEDDVITLIYNR